MNTKTILIGVGALLVLRYLYKKNKSANEPFVIEETTSNATGVGKWGAKAGDCFGKICPPTAPTCRAGQCI